MAEDAWCLNAVEAGHVAEPRVQIFPQVLGVAELEAVPHGRVSGPVAESGYSGIASNVEEVTLKKLRFGSWKLAGMCKKAALEVFQSVVAFDVMAVQEIPKCAPGWHQIREEGVEGWIHQDVITYRGIGIMYRPSKVVLLKKYKAERGVWMKFRHEESGKVFWAGSTHLPKNEPLGEYRRLAAEVIGALPAWDGPLILLGDVNADFQWLQSEDGVVNVTRDPKKEILHEVFGEEGFRKFRLLKNACTCLRLSPERVVVALRKLMQSMSGLCRVAES